MLHLATGKDNPSIPEIPGIYRFGRFYFCIFSCDFQIPHVKIYQVFWVQRYSNLSRIIKIVFSIWCRQSHTHMPAHAPLVWCMWKNSTCHFCWWHWGIGTKKMKERTRTSNLIADHFSLTFLNLSLAWMLYFHVWLENKGKFLVWSEYYNQFGIYQPSHVSMYLRTTLSQLKACVRYFSLFLKGQCVSWLFWTKYFEKEFNLQMFYLSTVSRTFILSWATTCYPPPWNFLFRKDNCMCNRDSAPDVTACPNE